MTYLYNNNKLSKIIKIQYEKINFNKGTKDIVALKASMKSRTESFYNAKSMSSRPKTPPKTPPKKQPTSQFLSQTRVRDATMMPFETKLEKVEESKNQIFKSQRTMDNNFDEVLSEEEDKNSKYEEAHRDQYLITHEEEDNLLKTLKQKNLGWFIRLCNWIKKKYSNQMILISSSKRLTAIEEDLRKGKSRVNTTLENKLLINYYVELNIGNDRVKALNSSMPERYKLENQRSDGLFKINSASTQLSTLIGLMVSNSSILCYIFMIIAHIVNGSLLSLVYPVSIFWYALFEEIRPSKDYWKFILLYTMIILILKTIIKTFYISRLISDSFNSFLLNSRFGLERINDEKDVNSSYYLYEILILLFVVMHMISLMLQGLWDRREIDIESIDQAATRVNKYQKGEPNKKQVTAQKKINFARSISDEF